MRVAYILPSLKNPSGWRTHSLAFLSAIREYLEPLIFVAADDYPEARDHFPDIPLYSLPVTQQASLSNWRGWYGLAACSLAVARGHYPQVDWVHSLEAYPTGLVGSWLAGKLDCPHALTSHGTYGVLPYAHWLDRRAYRRVLRRTRLVCPVSLGTARQMQVRFGQALSETRLEPILNGNDFYKTVPQKQAFERSIPDIPTLLSVGDVKPRKGQHVSLAAFAKIKAQLPEARYWIAGSYSPNAYFRQLQEFIRANGVEDVTFLGSVSDEDLRRCYQEASVFVLAPQQDGLHFEGFGLVYLEAGAYGLPVVGTRSGGVPDAIREGQTGFLADPEDVDGLAQSLLRLLTDPDLARQMGHANRQWAETLTWDRYAAQQYQAYQEALVSP